MHTITIGKYTVLCDHQKSGRVARDIEDAVVVEKLENEDEYNEYIYYGITDCGVSPDLVVEGYYSPASVSGFYPGILILPNENIMFFGAGDIVQIWQLSPYKKIHEESPECGFWGWSTHNDLVIMTGELELAAWNNLGEKLWSKFVEPPWYYEVQEETITTNVMDYEESFNIYTGK